MERKNVELKNISEKEEKAWNNCLWDDDDFFSSPHYRTASRTARIGIADMLLNGALICVAMAAYALFFHLF